MFNPEIFQYHCLDFAFESVTSQEEPTICLFFFFFGSEVGFFVWLVLLFFFTETETQRGFTCLGLGFVGFFSYQMRMLFTGTRHLANKLKSFCSLQRQKEETRDETREGGIICVVFQLWTEEIKKNRPITMLFYITSPPLTQKALWNTSYVLL